MFLESRRFGTITLIGTLPPKWSTQSSATVFNASISFPPRTTQCLTQDQKSAGHQKAKPERMEPAGRKTGIQNLPVTNDQKSITHADPHMSEHVEINTGNFDIDCPIYGNLLRLASRPLYANTRLARNCFL